MQLIRLFDQQRWNSLAAFLALVMPLNAFSQASLVDSSFLVGAGATGSSWGSGVYSILVHTNGGIFVGGRFDAIAGNSHSNLARLNSDGSYDASLATGTDGGVTRLLQQPDGKILVVGGFTNLQSAIRHKIGRLLVNGEVDPAFDAGSLLETGNGGLTLGLQPDGKVLVAPVADFGGFGTTGRLFRLHSNGALDETFVQTNLFMGFHIFAIHVRTNGTILVGGGFSSAGDHASPGLVLLHPDGRPDTNFNAQLENLSTVFSILEQTNGNLFVGGVFRRAGASNDTMLARLTANLEWDASFSTDVFLTYPKQGGWPLVRAVLEQPDGKLVVTGDFRTIGGYWRQHVARLDAQGHVDPCFDPGLGLVSTSLGGVTLARQDEGGILVGGYFDSVDGRPCANIARLLPQSDCAATRVHFERSQDGNFYVAGTSPPGGTNFLEYSTNLLSWADWNSSSWQDIYEESGSFFIYHAGPSSEPTLFFRLRKAY